MSNESWNGLKEIIENGGEPRTKVTPFENQNSSLDSKGLPYQIH